MGDPFCGHFRGIGFANSNKTGHVDGYRISHIIV
jgi:hypothetical protein